jgi:hypothetical protein
MKLAMYKVALIGAVLSLGLVACYATIPSAPERTQIKGAVSASTDETFQALMEIAERRNARIIASSPESGLLSVHVQIPAEEGGAITEESPWIFVTIFIQPREINEGTLVYLFPRTRYQYVSGLTGVQFFRELNQILEGTRGA